jgi:hypothetical protein
VAGAQPAVQKDLLGAGPALGQAASVHKGEHTGACVGWGVRVCVSTELLDTLQLLSANQACVSGTGAGQGTTTFWMVNLLCETAWAARQYAGQGGVVVNLASLLGALCSLDKDVGHMLVR